MRKLLLSLLAFIALAVPSRAQTFNGPTYIMFAGAPTGSCAQNALAINLSNGNFYDCLSGSWNAVTGGGGGSGTVMSVSSGNLASLFTVSIATPTTTPAFSFAFATGQTAHEVIGTCGAATTVSLCALVAGDIPQLSYSSLSGTPTATSVALTVPSWLTVSGSPVAPNGTLAVAPTAAQTSHQVIGTCGSATTFAPCSLVAGDIPTAIPIANIGSAGLSAVLPLVIAPTGAINTTSVTGFRYGTAGAADAAATAAQAATLIQGLTGCNTANFVFTPQASDCVAQSGGGSGGGVVGYSGLPVVSATVYVPLQGDTVGSTTVANVGWPAPSAAPISNMYAYSSSVPGTGNTLVVTLMDGSTAESVTCTITAAANSCNDTTHSFTPAAGDLLSWRISPTGTVVITPNIQIGANWATPQAGGVNSGTANSIAGYSSAGATVGSVTLAGGLSDASNTLTDQYATNSGCDQYGSQWSNQTVSNTTSPTVMVTCTVSAALGANQTIVVDADGIMATGGTAGTFTIALAYGGVTVCTTPTQAITSTLTANKSWFFHCSIMGTAASGSSVAVNATGYFNYATAATTGVSWQMPNASTVAAVNTTASQTMTLTVTWGTAQSSNTITGQIFRMHREG